MAPLAAVLVLLARAAEAAPREYDTKPITDAKVIAKMRREGKLPDSYVKGRCRYDLGGDPGAAYYHVTCRQPVIGCNALNFLVDHVLNSVVLSILGRHC